MGRKMKFLSTVCISAILIAVFRILVPENKFKKQISFLAAGVFLLSGISAISRTEFDFSLDNPELLESESFVQFSGEVNENLRKKICDDMSEKIYTLLNEHEICPKEVHIIVNISGLYSISIRQVKLVFGEGEQAAAEAAAELLSRELAGGVEIKTVLQD